MQQLMQEKLKFTELDPLNGNFLFLKPAQSSSYYESKCLTIILSAFQSSGFPGFRNDQRNASEFHVYVIFLWVCL